jgi:hypothetical protein
MSKTYECLALFRTDAVCSRLWLIENVHLVEIAAYCDMVGANVIVRDLETVPDDAVRKSVPVCDTGYPPLSPIRVWFFLTGPRPILGHWPLEQLGPGGRKRLKRGGHLDARYLTNCTTYGKIESRRRNGESRYIGVSTKLCRIPAGFSGALAGDGRRGIIPNWFLRCRSGKNMHVVCYPPGICSKITCPRN